MQVDPQIVSFYNATSAIVLNSLPFRKPFQVDELINQEMQKRLPMDIWKKVFLLLDRRGIGSTARTCRFFNNLIENKVTWEAMKSLIPEPVFKVRIKLFENRNANIDVAENISKQLLPLMPPLPSYVSPDFVQKMLKGLIEDIQKES